MVLGTSTSSHVAALQVGQWASARPFHWQIKLQAKLLRARAGRERARVRPAAKGAPPEMRLILEAPCRFKFTRLVILVNFPTKALASPLRRADRCQRTASHGRRLSLPAAPSEKTKVTKTKTGVDRDEARTLALQPAIH